MAVARTVKFLLLLPVAAAFAVAQGYGVFLFRAEAGPFMSLAGLKCVGIPVLIEAVITVITLRNLDQLHANAMANPHSPIGTSLRQGSKPVPEPPPARDAWDGAWEDPARTADKMAGDR